MPESTKNISCPWATDATTLCVVKDGKDAIVDDACVGCKIMFVSMAQVRRIQQQLSKLAP
jgi:hypothetical protein